MSLKKEELELHRQLLAAFDEYIRLNLKWEQKGFRADGRRTRKALRKIMNIAYLRWQELLVRLQEMEVEKGNKRGERFVIKDPGLAFIQSLNVASKKKKSNSTEDNNTST